MTVGLHSITYAGFFYEDEALTVEQIVDRAKRFGYDAVEVMAKRPICSPFDFDSERAKQLRRYAETQGIAFCMVAGYIDLPRPDALDREKELVFAKETFRLAKDLGAPSVRVYAGGEHLLTKGHPFGSNGTGAWKASRNFCPSPNPSEWTSPWNGTSGSFSPQMLC